MVFVWLKKNLMTPRCSHEHAKASTDRCLCLSCLSFILGVFFTNSIMFGMQSNLSIHTLRTTPKPPWFSPSNNGSTFVVFGIHNTPQLPIWVKKIWTPYSIHGVNLNFFFEKFFKDLARHEIFSTSPPTMWSNAPCHFMDKGHHNIATSLWLHYGHLLAIIKGIKHCKWYSAQEPYSFWSKWGATNKA